MLKPLFIIVFVYCAATAIAQPAAKEQLLQQRKKLDQEIAGLRQQLLHTSGAIGRVNNLQQQLAQTIARRSALVAAINRQLAVINNQLEETTVAARQTEARLAQLKKEYTRLVIVAYKHKYNAGIVSFIFSAGSFNEALQRLQYARHYRQYRARQLQLIKQYSAELQNKTLQLAQTQTDKSNAFAQQQAAMQQLQAEKQQLQQEAVQWQQQRLLIQRTVEQKYQQRRNLVRQIALIIRNSVVNNGHPRPAPAGRPAGKAPQQQTVASGGFAAFKGRLLCPVNGYVYLKFGVYKLAGSEVTGDNQFLSLGTRTAGMPVTAVFAGTVQSVARMNDNNTSIVIVNHGDDYVSVYANLGSVAVVKGQAVTAGLQLGAAAPNEDKPGEGLLEFMLMKGRQTINPSLWVGCR